MPRPPTIAAILLAAGQASRMRQATSAAPALPSKLVAEIDGVAMVRLAAAALLATPARPVVVVTGHAADAVGAALAGLDVRLVHAAYFARGMSASLAAGIRALPTGIDGVMVALADMPRVEAADIERLIAAFDPAAGRSIVVPVFGGRRGHPVLWAARFLGELAAVTGDKGGRELIARHGDQVHEVAAAGDGVLVDIDTPDELAKARGRSAPQRPRTTD